MRGISTFIALLFTLSVFAQNDTVLRLAKPSSVKGKTVMEALALRSSAKEFDSTSLGPQDVSDLLWAACGINRPGSQKRTAPSAMNTQDIDVYLINSKGAYVYQPANHSLRLIREGDFRYLVAATQKYFANAAMFLVMVSDTSRFKHGDAQQKLQLAAMDAAVISQNINLYCAGVGLKTRPRVYMNRDKLRKVLKLTDNQILMMNNPVGR